MFIRPQVHAWNRFPQELLQFVSSKKVHETKKKSLTVLASGFSLKIKGILRRGCFSALCQGFRIWKQRENRDWFLVSPQIKTFCVSFPVQSTREKARLPLPSLNWQQSYQYKSTAGWETMSVFPAPSHSWVASLVLWLCWRGQAVMKSLQKWAQQSNGTGQRTGAESLQTLEAVASKHVKINPISLIKKRQSYSDTPCSYGGLSRTQTFCGLLHAWGRKCCCWWGSKLIKFFGNLFGSIYQSVKWT